MMNILKTFGREQTRAAATHTDTVYSLDIDEMEFVAGGTKTLPPSGASEGGGYPGPIGLRDPRFF